MAVTYTLAPDIFQQYFDDDGNPADGYQLFTYTSGTSTKLATYTDAAGAVAQTNPIRLTSAGRPPSPIYFQPLAYKVVLALPEDTDPPTSPLQTVDPAGGIPAQGSDIEVVGVAGEVLTATDYVYLSAGDGGRTAGRWYKADADLSYGSLMARELGFCMNSATGADAITVRIGGRMDGLSGLTAGSLYYISATAGAITATPPQNPKRVGQADSTTTLVMAVDQPATSFRLNYSANPGLSNATTVETTIGTYTFAANALQSGMCIDFNMVGTAANNANAKTLKAYIGVTSVTLVNASTALVNVTWEIRGQVICTSTTAARIWAHFMSDGAVIADTVKTALNSSAGFTGTVEVKITATGVNTADLTSLAFSVSSQTTLTD